MALVTLNGWPAISSRLDPRLRTIKIPGTARSITTRRVAAPLFAAFLADWHREMPKRLKLDKGYIGGWVYREARNASALSNHASGTAVDTRWDVLLPDNTAHMTEEERKILKRILKRYVTDDGHHVLANGYAWKKCDEMHTELSQEWDKANGAKRNTTMKDVKNVITRLKIDSNGRRPL